LFLVYILAKKTGFVNRLAAPAAPVNSEKQGIFDKKAAGGFLFAKFVV